MSALVMAAGHRLGVVRQRPMRFVVGVALVVSIAATGFAVGRATSDRQAVAVNGGSLAIGAVHPARGKIVYHRTQPAQASGSAIRGRHNLHPAEALVSVFTPEQAAKDCEIHRHLSC
jgi:hypothetical protein